MPDTDVLDDTSDAASFWVRVDAFQQDRRRGSRRRRLAAAVLAVVVAGVLVPVGLREYRHRVAGASVSVVGSWVLQEVDHDGRPTVTAADLADDGRGVALQFTDRGAFQLQGGCAGTVGHYRVSLDEVSFRNGATPAVGCGYATAAGERVGTEIALATGAAYENGAVVSTPAADRLQLTVHRGTYVLHYLRDPSPRPGQLLPS